MTFSPNLGRWLQQDPIGYAGGTMNLYEMEGNNPINSTDPSGLILEGTEEFKEALRQYQAEQQEKVFNAISMLVNQHLEAKGILAQNKILFQLIDSFTAKELCMAAVVVRERLVARPGIVGKPIDPKKLEKIVADLDSGQFDVRQRASKMLAELATETDLPQLKAAKDKAASIEVSRALDQIITKLEAIAAEELRKDKFSIRLLFDLAKEGRKAGKDCVSEIKCALQEVIRKRPGEIKKLAEVFLSAL
jgi:hypothetical protein